jgi:hypothetical protein
MIMETKMRWRIGICFCLAAALCAVSNAGFNLGIVSAVKSKVSEMKTNAGNGTITGMVRDASTGNPLSGVAVNLFSGSVASGGSFQAASYGANSLIVSGVTDSSGTYTLTATAGAVYSLEYTISGYQHVVYRSVSVSLNGVSHLETVQQIDDAHAGTGNAAGIITSALTGVGIEGLNLKLRAGMNTMSGAVVLSTATDSSGNYLVYGLPGGCYTAQVTKSGINTAYFTVIVLGGLTTSNQNFSVTPILSGDETRIILTWGDHIRDLDSHLTGPLADSSDRFHIYYSVRGSSFTAPYAELDHDVIYWYGPETITIYKQISGVYRYSVYNFSGEDLMSKYDATVKVYRGNNLIRTYNMPTTGQAGNIWKVFELNGNTFTDFNIFKTTTSYSDVNAFGFDGSDSDAQLFKNLPPKR